ncbi:GNAT family N-acetyltransferase [Sutcliffiella rhizosphaerae]|uniref:L-amino acid N-acetyltransferase AaaT n=1 Tax=Sutcliffiella rhizosphaerae TaxID=2880967 RepID=A0ABM8YTZ7_9BACI|nr:GNAT family protein [Sutcliffiella rhizosphaerae]CAG9623440.1 L-amino acid N-acetyltransferase AaaT [Sutcliffiella rhizosphaerae]
MVIREAVFGDAAQIIDHSKKVFKEGRNLLTTPEEYTITLEEEVEWLKNNKEKNQLVLVAENASEIVGMLNVTRGSRKRVSHICFLGISIQSAYCNNGLGSEMLLKMLEWAKKDKHIEKVSLEVFSHNERAIHVYKKLGFKVEGLKEKHVKFEDGTYSDELLMAQFVKKSRIELD